MQIIHARFEFMKKSFNNDNILQGSALHMRFGHENPYRQ
jgi:hypothetical protein